VVKGLKVGEHGVAYILDAQDRVIAHSNMVVRIRDAQDRPIEQVDSSLFQQDSSNLPHVQRARGLSGDAAGRADAGLVQGSQGREVLRAYAAIGPLGWLVFVEVPVEEANALLQ
jgi:two-component system, NtrC family, sensor kinase